MGLRTKIIGLAVFILLIGNIIFVSVSSEKIEIVDCYDKYGNKILDQSCEKKTIEYEYLTSILMILSILLSFAFIISYALEDD